MLGTNARGHIRIGWRGWVGAGLFLFTVLIWIPHSVYAAAGGFALAHWRALLTGLVILVVAGIAGSTVVARKRQTQEPRSEGDETKPLLREIPGWAIWAGMAVLVAVGLLATWWLVTRYGSGDSKTIEQNRIKLEAIKLAGSVVVGTGGVAALLLAARRQRVSELDLLQRDRVAEANRHDADERRATDLYTAAAEQLASDKAPVRMAGMYALSRLGETNENLRQTIINLLCAYLRMPDISIGNSTTSSSIAPEYREDGEALQRLENSSRTIVLDLASAPLAALSSLAPDLSAQRKQEHQVRLTAQRLLTQHLRQFNREADRGKDTNRTNRSYWPEMDINLADASLHEWDFSGCKVRSADFQGAQFHGITWFVTAQFHEGKFHSAQFHDGAWLNSIRFHDDANFSDAQFHGFASLSGAHFHGTALFDRAKFHGNTGFHDVRFRHSAWFLESQFYANAWFNGAQFEFIAGFNEAQFHDAAEFKMAQFYELTEFDDTQFLDDTSFYEVQFHSTARLDAAYFAKETTFNNALARIDLSGYEASTWPYGWTAHPVNLKDEREGQWGRLAPDKTT